MWITLLLVYLVQPATPEASSFGAVSRPVVHPTFVRISATGIGYPPAHMRGAQARLMAQRAAEVVAVRNLAARLNLPNGSRVGSFRYVSTRHLPGGAIEVTVESIVQAR